MKLFRGVHSDKNAIKVTFIIPYCMVYIHSDKNAIKVIFIIPYCTCAPTIELYFSDVRVGATLGGLLVQTRIGNIIGCPKPRKQPCISVGLSRLTPIPFVTSVPFDSELCR